MSVQRRSVYAITLAVACVAGLSSCDRVSGGSTASAPVQAEPGMDAIYAVPLGDVAGAAASTLADRLPNPYTGDPQAIQEGRNLFVKMNCAGCHGYDAKGGMGPNLTDGYWRYRGVPVAIFSSIYEGRPQGMPAWNPALPPQDIWKIVAYIESLGGTYPATQFQAAIQGDRPGDNVAPEVNSTPPPGATNPNVKKPAVASPPGAASNPDVAPPPGTGK